MADDILKNIWPEWHIEGKPLGSGSYGVVYKAVRRDHNVESVSAVKVISIPSSDSEIDSLCSEGLSMREAKSYIDGIVNDFASEIRLMESFKGVQNIVSVEDYKVVEKSGGIGSDIYIRMELLTPFNKYAAGRTLSEAEVIKLGVDMCSALELCSKKNVIHRDIKPENIFINEFGSFKLGDFGIARKLENATGSFSRKGTVSYMAPEVGRGENYDATVDIYSLGVVLYRLLNNNKLPFMDTSKPAMTPQERDNANKRRLSGEPLPPPCGASEAMSDVILCACSPEPSGRFATAAAMKRALLSVQSELEPEATNRAFAPAGRAADPNATVALNVPLPELPPEKKAADNGAKRGSGAPAASGGAPDGAQKKKKKSPLPVIIAAIFGAAILAAAAFILLPRVLESANDKLPSSAKATIFADESGEPTASPETVVTPDPTEAGVYSEEETAQINAILAAAEELAAAGNYTDALAKVNSALNKYPRSEELKAKAEEYSVLADEQRKQAALDTAAAAADAGDYALALKTLSDYAAIHGEDADCTAAYERYCTEYETKVVSEAKSLAAKGDYLGAVNAVKAALAVIESEALTAELETCSTQFVDDAIARADAEIAKNNIPGAEKIINDALKELPNDPRLKQKLTQLASIRPVSITTLDPLNQGGWSWNEGEPVDPFGNDYSSACNYSIHTNSHGYSIGNYIEYRVYENYTVLTASLAPYTSISENGWAYIRVYADDVLSYTSPKITRKTDAFSFSVDVSGAEYIRIVVYVDAYSSLILSDVQLYKAAEAIELDPGADVSITTTILVNSNNWSWENAYPEDTSDTDYTRVKNYSVPQNSHGYQVSGYAEYRLYGQYSTVKGTIAPYVNISTNGSGYLQIYADDVLIYTSPTLTQKTAPVEFVLSVDGVEYLKIEFILSAYSSLVLANVMLTPQPA